MSADERLTHAAPCHPERVFEAKDRSLISFPVFRSAAFQAAAALLQWVPPGAPPSVSEDGSSLLLSAKMVFTGAAPSARDSLLAANVMVIRSFAALKKASGAFARSKTVPRVRFSVGFQPNATATLSSRGNWPSCVHEGSRRESHGHQELSRVNK